MPPRIRELKAWRRRAGFVWRRDRGKGSHTIWTHQSLPGLNVVLSGGDGNDAKEYQERDVRQALAALDRTRAEGDR